MCAALAPCGMAHACHHVLGGTSVPCHQVLGGTCVPPRPRCAAWQVDAGVGGAAGAADTRTREAHTTEAHSDRYWAADTLLAVRWAADTRTREAALLRQAGRRLAAGAAAANAGPRGRSTLVSTALGLSQLILVFRLNEQWGIPSEVFCLGAGRI